MKRKKLLVLMAALFCLLVCLSGSALADTMEYGVCVKSGSSDQSPEVDYDDFGDSDDGLHTYDNLRYMQQGDNPYAALVECATTGISSARIHSDTKLIDDYAFLGCRQLKAVIIPKGVTQIGSAVFDGCGNLTDVFFLGSKDQWEQIPKGAENTTLENATVHFCGLDGSCTEADCSAGIITIRTQPVDAVAALGEKATVTVDAFGEGLTYKWYYKNKGASKFSLTTSYKGSSYSVEMNADRAGRQVYCVITDKYGFSATSDTATIGLKNEAKITKQPANALVVKGATAKVTVGAAGDGITYKWYYKNKGASKFTLTTSYKGSSYSVEMNADRAGRQVYCVVTDKYGNKVTTKTVTLNLKTVAKITKQPVNALAVKGATAKVTVGAAGDGITYKWYYKNKGAGKFTLSKTFKGSSYSAEMNADRAGRQVYCVVTDKYGNTVKTNTVTLNLKITKKLLVGETFKIEEKSNTTIKYSTSNSKVATVSSKGVITAKAAGTATITVKSGSATSKITVKVTKPTVSVSAKSSSVYREKKLQLKAVTSPSGVKVSWSVSNKKVATISSSGVLTAKKKGTVTVTATISYKGKTYKDTYKVTVKVQSPSVSVLVDENWGYTDSPKFKITNKGSKTLKVLAKGYVSAEGQKGTVKNLILSGKAYSSCTVAAGAKKEMKLKLTGGEMMLSPQAVYYVYFEYDGETYAAYCDASVIGSNKCTKIERK